MQLKFQHNGSSLNTPLLAYHSYIDEPTPKPYCAAACPDSLKSTLLRGSNISCSIKNLMKNALQPFRKAFGNVGTSCLYNLDNIYKKVARVVRSSHVNFLNKLSLHLRLLFGYLLACCNVIPLDRHKIAPFL